MVKKVEPKQKYSPRIYTWQLEQIPTDDTTHDELMKAFNQYYLANLTWMQTGTKQSAVDVRYWLNEIHLLGVQRRKFILEWKKKISDKSLADRSYKSTTKKERKAYQKQALQDALDDKYRDE